MARNRRETPYDERRKFYRHPASVPMRCRRRGHRKGDDGSTRNVSNGGVAFVSPKPFTPGDVLELEFPSLRHNVNIQGEIVWTTPLDTHHYLSGLRFNDEHERLRARLVEQMCEIDRYHRVQNERYGRDLSREEAAEEWVTRFAERYPR